jgi:hypothetical protein
VEEKLRAITQVLASFGILETIARRKQERLLRAIFENTRCTGRLMTDLMPEDEQLADNIVGTVDYEAAPRPKREFEGWHRPRKQLVRVTQWADQILALLNDVQPEGGIFRYLGLPGVDLLDLRYFHKAICEPRKLGLRFLGFNSAAGRGSRFQVELDVSLDEVKKLANVDPRSDVIADNIRRLADENSIAFARARSLGPYDVINLDLCDGFGRDLPGGLDNTNYSTVTRILSLQLHSKPPWLLFLTTRAGRNDIHSELLDRLGAKYIQNLTDCEAFRISSAQHFSIGNHRELHDATKTPEGLLPVFLTGICKWLVGLAVSNNPQAEVEVKSVIGYRIAHDSACEDLISVAFRFDPKLALINDPQGLAAQSSESVDECRLAARALRSVAKRVNADLILARDEALRREMTDSTALLLEIARYDKDEYYGWVAETEGWPPMKA